MAQGYIRTLDNEGQSIFDITFPLTVSFLSKQYHFVKDTTGGALAIAGAGDLTIGVLQDANDGSTKTNVATVRMAGLTRLLLGGDVSIGGYVKSDTNGAAVAVTPGETFEGFIPSGGLSGETVLAIVCHGVSHT